MFQNDENKSGSFFILVDHKKSPKKGCDVNSGQREGTVHATGGPVALVGGHICRCTQASSGCMHELSPESLNDHVDRL